MFSVVQPDSFRRVATQWIPEVKRWGPKVPILLVGSESDRRNDPKTLNKSSKKNECPVAAEMEHKLAQKVKAVKYLESFRTSNVGVRNIFHEAVCVAIGSTASS